VKVGIIDIGSNTFNLFIAETNGHGDYTPLYRSKVPVKLGEGSFEKRYITEEAMKRAMVALDAQMMAIRNQYCDQVLAFATSAVRNATNGAEFVQKVRERFGIGIHVIDGEREASLIWSGTRLAGALTQGKSLIMDIGGGSTEFIIASEQEVFWKRSYEMGVTRLIERFRPSDPLTPAETQEISRILAESTTEVIAEAQRHEVTRLVGSSGSFDTFCDVLAHRNRNYPAVAEKKTVPFHLPSLRAHLDELVASSLSQREKMPGMVDFRVKMIAMSALMVRTLLIHVAIEEAVLSRYSLKEGALFELMSLKS
jgi:exopolyphosphatase/guanosine-5'-triphosphate,3'-diphosphate pyrophosphatase